MKFVYVYIKNYMGKISKYQQLKHLQNDSKLGSHLTGWITQELNYKKKKKKNNIRNPPGYDLAHERGRENAKGFGYEHTNLVLKKDHKIQHKFDNLGKNNKTRNFDILYK